MAMAQLLVAAAAVMGAASCSLWDNRLLTCPPTRPVPAPPCRATWVASSTTAASPTARRRSGWCTASWPSASSRCRWAAGWRLSDWIAMKGLPRVAAGAGSCCSLPCCLALLPGPGARLLAGCRAKRCRLPCPARRTSPRARSSHLITTLSATATRQALPLPLPLLLFARLRPSAHRRPCGRAACVWRRGATGPCRMPC